jgi:hypothetical protein
VKGTGRGVFMKLLVEKAHTQIKLQSQEDLKSSVAWDITACSPIESQLTFQMNMSPPFSGSKNKRSKKPA